MWDKFADWIIYWGMPVVASYHLVCGNIFLNVQAEDAEGLEKWGNYLLTPVQFLLCGKVATPTEEGYIFQQRFDYTQDLPLKSSGAILSFPLSLSVGSLCKGLSYISTSTQERAERLRKSIERQLIAPKIAHYENLGLEVKETTFAISPPQHQRRPGDEKVLGPEKELLQTLSTLFKEHQIPFWVDCGTCLGTYRYGGAIPWDKDVDLAALLPDFDNIWNLLKGLDPDKYLAQDWSNRCRPKTYIRIYLKETRNHIDVYFFTIDPLKKTLSYILSNEISSFMLESWKIRERRFTVATPYEVVFPLKRAAFDGVDVFVPHQTERYLQDRYGKDLSPPRVYSEITGEYEKDLSHPYWRMPCVSY